jgi:hypothetical protein
MNGHGGKRQGSGRKKAPHTIQAEAFKAFLIEKVIAEQEPIVTALISKAKSGDVPALKEVMERVLGKPVPILDPEDAALLPFQLIIKQTNGKA